MKPAKTSITKLYSESISAVVKNPKIYLPFAVFAGLEALSLVMIYFIPRQPLVGFFGPPITTFWGNRFLQYPFYFLLMPKLASLARMWLSVIAGSYLSGAAVSLLYKKPARAALKKYISLFLIVLIITLLFYFSNKFYAWLLVKYFSAGHMKLLFAGPRWWFGPIMTVANFSMALVIQALFVYTIPALMLDAKFFSAIAQSVVLCAKNAVTTLLLVGLPMLIYVPIIILNSNGAFLIDKLFPEVILIVALIGTAASSLVIDFLVTISTAVFYRSSKNV